MCLGFKGNADPVQISLCKQRCSTRHVSEHTATHKSVKVCKNNLAEADLQLTNKFDKAVAGSLLIFMLQALTWCLVQYAIKIFPERFLANELCSRNVITKVEICPVISHTHSSRNPVQHSR